MWDISMLNTYSFGLIAVFLFANPGTDEGTGKKEGMKTENICYADQSYFLLHHHS